MRIGVSLISGAPVAGQGGNRSGDCASARFRLRRSGPLRGRLSNTQAATMKGKPMNKRPTNGRQRASIIEQTSSFEEQIATLLRQSSGICGSLQQLHLPTICHACPSAVFDQNLRNRPNRFLSSPISLPFG